jgi:hypothetical protein
MESADYLDINRYVIQLKCTGGPVYYSRPELWKWSVSFQEWHNQRSDIPSLTLPPMFQRDQVANFLYLIDFFNDQPSNYNSIIQQTRLTVLLDLYRYFNVDDQYRIVFETVIEQILSSTSYAKYNGADLETLTRIAPFVDRERSGDTMAQLERLGQLSLH